MRACPDQHDLRIVALVDQQSVVLAMTLSRTSVLTGQGVMPLIGVMPSPSTSDMSTAFSLPSGLAVAGAYRLA